MSGYHMSMHKIKITISVYLMKIWVLFIYMCPNIVIYKFRFFHNTLIMPTMTPELIDKNPFQNHILPLYILETNMNNGGIPPVETH